MPTGQHQRIVVDRDQGSQAGVGPAQQRAQVVVLPEERVEAPAHRHRLAAMINWPGPDASAELVLRFDQDHRNAALGESGRGGEPGDAAAGHDHGQHRRIGPPVRPAGPDGVRPFDPVPDASRPRCRCC